MVLYQVGMAPGIWRSSVDWDRVRSQGVPNPKRIPTFREGSVEFVLIPEAQWKHSETQDSSNHTTEQ